MNQTWANLLLTAFALVSNGARAEDPHAAHRQRVETVALKAIDTTIRVPDVMLVDSNGETHHLPTLLRNKIVVLDFVFTSCQTICPAFSAIMKSTAKSLARGETKGVLFVSVSVDPINDTPDKLREFSRKLGAGANWYWLTGRPADVSQVLRAFGVPAAGRPEDHPPVILVGNPSEERWMRWIGMPAHSSLTEAVESFAVGAIR